MPLDLPDVLGITSATSEGPEEEDRMDTGGFKVVPVEEAQTRFEPPKGSLGVQNIVAWS